MLENFRANVLNREVLEYFNFEITTSNVCKCTCVICHSNETNAERFSDFASVIGNNSWERGKKKKFPTFDSAGYESIFSYLSIWTSSRAINGHNLVTK